MVTRINLVLLMFLLVFACGTKEEDPTKMIAGGSFKTWKAVKETNSEGDKEKLSEQEKNDMMVFNADGSFSMHTAAGKEDGSWNYDASSKNLSLQFRDQNVTENFQVLDLKEDKIKLKAGDGSELTLENEDL